MPEVLVPPARMARWFDNFRERHGDTALSVAGGALSGVAVDGSTFDAHLPFSEEYAGRADVADFVSSAVAPASWGLLLVRKGGFAVARFRGEAMVEHKVGRRHVQGRTKAGGQSQQRFARRRDNQARAAYDAATDHAVRILSPGPVVVGGDREAIDAVLADPRLSGAEPTGRRLAVPEPRRAVLDQAAVDARSIRVRVDNADTRGRDARVEPQDK